MKLEKSVERQTKNTIEYYKNLDNLEEVPIDILRAMYKDLLKNSIPKKKIEDEIEELNEEFKNYEVDINCSQDNYYELSNNYAFAEKKLQELLEDK